LCGASIWRMRRLTPTRIRFRVWLEQSRPHGPLAPWFGLDRGCGRVQSCERSSQSYDRQPVAGLGSCGNCGNHYRNEFWDDAGSSTVKFNGTVATPTNWNATSIVAPVPSGTTSGNVVVTVSGAASNGVGFTVSAIRHVQQAATGDESGATYASFSATFGSATTTGNAIILGLAYGNVNPSITARTARATRTQRQFEHTMRGTTKDVPSSTPRTSREARRIPSL